METIETYMSNHAFLESDKQKVRTFIKKHDAFNPNNPIVHANLTRTTLFYTERNGL